MSILLLRTTPSDGVSAREHIHGGFKWPKEIGAVVTAPDWNLQPECGGGLHGLPWGEGDGTLLDWSPGALWWVVEAEEAVMIDGGSKAKAPKVTIRYIGDQLGATNYLLQNGAAGRVVVGAAVTAGYKGRAIAGYLGTATAGDYGTAITGYRGVSTVGKEGIAIAGKEGKATAGTFGQAFAGTFGTATAGDGGTATAGDGGTATAGDGGIINLRWWDGARYRITTLYVGEDGIEPNTFYRLDANERPEKMRLLP